MISIIIPCYNAAKTIRNQLEAFANQNHCTEAWEIIVADNGSTDDSRQIVISYQQKLPNLQFVDASAKKGSAYARNVGVAASKGDKLAFCDADDEATCNWVAVMSQALDQYDFVAGALEPKKLNEAWTIKSRYCPQQNGLQSYTFPPYLAHAATANMGCKRAIYDALGGFDENFVILNDTDYCWRAQLAGVKPQFVPELVVHYRYRHSLKGIYLQSYGYAEENILLYKKYRSNGMPKLYWPDELQGWRKVLRRAIRIRSKLKYAQWLWLFGRQMGRLLGRLKYRIFVA